MHTIIPTGPRNMFRAAEIVALRDNGFILIDRGDAKAFGNWRSLRLIKSKSNAGKHSFWLGWSLAEKRFSRRDCQRALQRRPELHDWALHAVQLDFSYSWVTQ